MSTLVSDFAFSLRQFRKHPGFAVGAIATLAVALAANTAVFSLVSGVLLHRTAGYLEAMNIPLLAGRRFADSDVEDSAGVVLINKAMADQFFVGEDPLGRRLRPHVGLAVGGRWATIVGVVGNVRHSTLRSEPLPEIYIPHPQQPVSSLSMVVRSTVPPDRLMSAARAVVSKLDPNLPVLNLQTLDEVYAASLASARFRSLLVSVFAAAAAVLAAIGLYGVMSYSVGSRAREFGIRMALGAGRSSILSSVLTRGLAWSLIGIGLGLGLAFALTRYLESLLFGVAALDLPTFAALSLLLLVVAAAASYLPARRATRVDPLEALRYE